MRGIWPNGDPPRSNRHAATAERAASDQHAADDEHVGAREDRQ
jgi:hypothetical protein